MIEQIVEQLTVWGKRKKRGDAEYLPYFSESHRFGSELAERISYHAEFDVFPEKLINSAAPNEDAKEFEYRRKNYQQVTKPVWDKALSTTYRIFNPQNYSIEWNNEEVEEYFTVIYPCIGSFPEFFKDVIHKMKYADPNAVAAVKPFFIPIKETVEGEEITYSVDQAERVSPIVELFPANKVFEYRSDWCLVLSKEYSEISVNGKRKKEGLVFEYYDNVGIYKIFQVGDQKDWTFDVQVYYMHDWEQMPVWKLKGIPKYDPIDILYYSHFMCAIPNLDQATFLNSTSFGVINKVAFPTRWYYEDDCGVCQGQGWVSNYDVDPVGRTSCSNCSGSGHKFTFTFGKDYVIPMPENVTQSDTTQLPTPPFGVVDPPVESIKFLDEKVKHLLDTAFLNLQIRVTEKPTGVSATEVADDAEELISFLSQVAGEEFYLESELINAMGYMRWNIDDTAKINKPTEYKIKSSTELTHELKMSMESNMPSPYRLKLLQETIRQRFNDDTLSNVVNVVELVDPLATATDQTVNSLTTTTLPKWWSTLHYCVYNFIYLKLQDNQNYLETDINTIKVDMEAMAKAATVQPTNTAKDILGTL